MGGREKLTRQEAREPPEGRFARKTRPNPAHGGRPLPVAGREPHRKLCLGDVLDCPPGEAPGRRWASWPVGGVTGEGVTRGPARGGRLRWVHRFRCMEASHDYGTDHALLERLVGLPTGNTCDAFVEMGQVPSVMRRLRSVGTSIAVAGPAFTLRQVPRPIGASASQSGKKLCPVETRSAKRSRAGTVRVVNMRHRE